MFYADNFCSYSEKLEDGKHYYTFSGVCGQCGKEVSVDVPGEALYAYRQGKLIQNAMPTLSSDDREFLVSGTCSTCWDELWKDNY